MKKLFLVGALALFGAMNAQTKFGLKAGYALSSLNATYDGTSVSGSKSTFYVGGILEHTLGDKLALNAELLYSPMGGKVTESASQSGITYTATDDTKLGYLLLPLGVKYYVANGFSLGAGLNFGFILSAKDDYSYNVLGTTDSGSEDIKDQVKGMNIAPYIGVAYKLENGVFFDTRYNFGLTNLNKSSDAGTVKNGFFQIGLGYFFSK